MGSLLGRPAKKDDSPPEDLLLDDIGYTNTEAETAAVAERLAEQAARVFASQEGWTADKGTPDVHLESKSVRTANPAKNGRGIRLVRSQGKVSCKAQELYDLLVSKEGYQLIDPDSDPDDFGKPILGPFRWGAVDSSDSPMPTAQIEYAKIKIPTLAARDFVVCNVFDPKSLNFASSSVLNGAHPGGSWYQSDEPLGGDGKFVRVAIAGVYGAVPDPEDGDACIFRVWQWLDLGGCTPGFVNNAANAAWFTPCYERVRKHVAETKKTK